MSSFNLQKSFEKSLRSASPQVPAVATLKTEIHKGCSGKAHACGSIKSSPLAVKPQTTPKPKVKNDGKTLRKNSLSSETVSDSGSEISSWNSNKDSSASSTAAPATQKSLLKRTNSVNYGAPNGSSTATARRRTSDSILSTDVPDRKASDGDKNGEADELSRFKRTSSFRAKNTPPVPPKPKIAQPQSPIKRNGSFNNRLRNSFRNKNPIFNWNTLWESSFAAKLGGGNLRVLDAKLLDKVNEMLSKQSLIDGGERKLGSRKRGSLPNGTWRSVPPTELDR